MKKLINDPKRYVDEALDGMTLAFPGFRKTGGTGRVIVRAAGAAVRDAVAAQPPLSAALS